MAKNTPAPTATNQNAPATHSVPRAAVSYEDIADELSVEFIKAKDLAECGSFNIVGVSKRAAQGRFPAQINYEVQFLEGKATGATSVVSLRETPMRVRLCEKVQQYGSIGPLVLIEGAQGNEGNNAPWVFVSPQAAKSGNAIPSDDAAGKE